MDLPKEMLHCITTANVSSAHPLGRQGVVHPLKRKYRVSGATLTFLYLLEVRSALLETILDGYLVKLGLLMIDLLAAKDNFLHPLVGVSAACHTDTPRKNECLFYFLSMLSNEHIVTGFLVSLAGMALE